MKLYVISDTHGKTAKAKKIFGRLTDVDLLIHLGDYKKDALCLEKELSADTIYVEGNMDGAMTASSTSRILETEYGKILLTHGHLEGVKYGYDGLIRRCMEEGCKAVLFGHTHEPVFTEREGIYLINPGSLTLPRDGSGGSYAVVYTSPEELRGSIVYYGDRNDPAGNRSRGGRLKNIFNYSDRF